MKRVWGHVLAGLALLGGGGATVAACVHDNSTLFIRQVLQQQLVSNAQQCLYTSDPTQPFIPAGHLDVDFRKQYDAVYLIGNQTVPRGDPNTPKAETSRITIQGGIVRITDAAGGPVKTYTRLTSATVDPQAGSAPSYSPVELTILDHDTVVGLLPTLGGPTRPHVRMVTYVRVYGYTLGGQYVESDEFEFPIDVCKGCLITFAPQDIDPNFPAPNCVAAKTGASTLPIPCNPGQDFTIDCSQCPGVAEADGLQDCNGVVPAGVGPVDAGPG
jgi:hypothetical protein